MIKFLFLTIFLFSCSTYKKPNFPNKKVCFLLFKLKSSTFEEIIGQKNCEERFPPASTFKVPLAIMAFDSGVLKDRDTMIKDHTAATWMRDSLVWFSQELTPKLGKEKIETYLLSFEYGNTDMSSGLKESWLTSHNSLKISGFEQLHFLKNLWRGELKTHTDAQLKTIDLLPIETSAAGNKLLGKTGSGQWPRDQTLRIGWWVGYLETKQDQYIIVMNFREKKKSQATTYGGPDAKEMVKQILTAKKLW